MKKTVLPLLIILILGFMGCPSPTGGGGDDGGSGGSSTPEEPQKIVLFGTAATFSGSLGGRTGADAKVAADAARPSGLTEVHAFLSVSETDSIKDFPETYGFSPELPIVGPDGVTVIADNWADLLDGTIASSLGRMGVVEDGKGEVWWSGSNADGSASQHTCNGWTDESGDTHGTAGYADMDDGAWIADHAMYEDPQFETGVPGSVPLQLIGLGLSSEDPGTYVPVTGISLNRTSVEMRTGETFQLTAQVEPADATRRDVRWYVSHRSQLDDHINPISISDDGLITGLATSKDDGMLEVVAYLPTPEGWFESRCTVTVSPSLIVVFSTEATHPADAGRIGGGSQVSVSSLIFNDPARPRGYGHHKALAAADGSGAADFADDPGLADHFFDPTVPVVGPGPDHRVIAESWNDLIAGNLQRSLVDAGVLPDGDTWWWSGMAPGGEFQDISSNAANWSSAASETRAFRGDGTVTDGSWVSADVTPTLVSGKTYRFLGIVW